MPSFNSVKELISKLQPNIISIATPTDSHLSILKEIIEVDSLKSVLMEKPLAKSFIESKEIYDLCKSKNLNLFVNFVRRCDPGINNLKLMIKQGEFKGSFQANVNYSKGLLHNGIHFIDIFMYLFGDIKDIHIKRICYSFCQR